jgi:hypothetical protein
MKCVGVSPKEAESISESPRHRAWVSGGSRGGQLEIAQRLRFLKMADYRQTQNAVEGIGKMLQGLIVSLEPENDDEL